MSEVEQEEELEIEQINSLVVLTAIGLAGPVSRLKPEQVPSVDAESWTVLNDSGLIPLCQYLMAKKRLHNREDWQADMQPIVAAAKSKTEQQTKAMSLLLDNCQKQKLDVCILKGMDLAYLVYPDPSLRKISDMDILVKTEQYDAIHAVLLESGFVQEELNTSGFLGKRQKSIRFHHVEFDVWVALHFSLLPRRGFARKQKLFAEFNDSQLLSMQWKTYPAKALKGSLNFLYLITQWANEFKVGQGVAGLVDLAYLLRDCEPHSLAEDLDEFLKSEPVLANACFIVLCYLYLHGIESDKLTILITKINKRHRVDGTQLRIAHDFIARYAVKKPIFAGILSETVVKSIWAAIISSRIRHANIAVLVWNIVFPCVVRQRYSPLYQLKRISRGFALLFSKKVREE